MAKKRQMNNGKKIRSVEEYLSMLALGGRSVATIGNYRHVLNSYAMFLNIPLDQVHNHLSVDNFLAYAGSRKGKSAAGRHTTFTILHRYMALQGVEFDEMELNIVKKKSTEDPDDKPIETETLQKMMDQGDPHSRAIIAFLISTGCRAGETSKILLSDVKSDVVTIRNEIAKGGHGGKVYLTSEAREYLDIWLKDRERYVEEANRMTKKLFTTQSGSHFGERKSTGVPIARPEKDNRLFACSYTTINKIFSRLYDQVDGEKGKYGALCSPHSCRKYFRTNAVKTMSLDLVEGLMRHTGYLNSVYVRMTDKEKRDQFHAGEAALYITRADHRIQTGELAELKRDKETMQAQMERMQAQIRALTEALIENLPVAVGVEK
jgi:integrase